MSKNTSQNTPKPSPPSLLPPGQSYSDERTRAVLTQFTQSALMSGSASVVERFDRESRCGVQFSSSHSSSPAYYSVPNPAFVITNWGSSSSGYRTGGLH